jgi:hypothetical protein
MATWRWFSFFLVLSCAYVLSLCWGGEFHEYTWAYGGKWVKAELTVGQRLPPSIVPGVLAAALSTVSYFLIQRVAPRRGAYLQLFAVLLVGFTALQYHFGDFNTYVRMGGGGTEHSGLWVKGEAPRRGPERLVCSAVCGLPLAGLTLLFCALVMGGTRAPESDRRPLSTSGS